MCVKSARVDVALVCLGNMQHAHGARALRAMADQPEHVQLATLAVHLGLIVRYIMWEWTTRFLMFRMMRRPCFVLLGDGI